MDIIAHKYNLYNSKDFILTLKKAKEIKGVMFDIVLTKDKKVLVFSMISANKKTIEIIQSNTMDELSDNNILTLDLVLEELNFFDYKVILNLIPLNEALLIEDYQKIVDDNLEYVRKVKDIVNKYNNLDIYLCSSSYNLLYQIIKFFPNNKKGVVLGEDSGSYIDLDFYIFVPLLLNRKIMDEQISLNKEVMIKIDDCDDLNLVLNFLENNKEVIDVYQYITNYPKIFYNCIYNIM